MWPFNRKLTQTVRKTVPAAVFVLNSPELGNNFRLAVAHLLNNGGKAMLFSYAPAYTEKLIPVGFGVGLLLQTNDFGQVLLTEMFSTDATSPILFSTAQISVPTWEHVQKHWNLIWETYGNDETKLREVYNELQSKTRLHRNKQHVET